MRDDCLKVLEQVELYLDGELDEAVRLRIHRHLELCSPCMDRSEFQRHLKELLRTSCGRDVFPERVLERIRTMLEGSPG